jgi:hypothetical protein
VGTQGESGLLFYTPNSQREWSMINKSFLSHMEKLLFALCGRGEDRTQHLWACESNALPSKLSCPPKEGYIVITLSCPISVCLSWDWRWFSQNRLIRFWYFLVYVLLMSVVRSFNIFKLFGLKV